MLLMESLNTTHISHIASLRWCIRSNTKGEKNCSTHPKDGIMAAAAHKDTDAPRLLKYPARKLPVATA
jgi:hypothetical protein